MKNGTIKNGLKVLLVAGLISGCTKTKDNSHCGKWILGYTNDDNWTRQVIICDSLQMTSRKSAIVYVNGIKTTVFAESFAPMYEPCH